LETFRRHELQVYPGMIGTVVLGTHDSVFAALQEAYHKASQQGQVIMTVTLSNACPGLEKEEG
jgi:uncharacterized protein YqgV (UPF0045/DUF77 family)